MNKSRWNWIQFSIFVVMVDLNNSKVWPLLDESKQDYSTSQSSELDFIQPVEGVSKRRSKLSSLFVNSTKLMRSVSSFSRRFRFGCLDPSEMADVLHVTSGIIIVIGFFVVCMGVFPRNLVSSYQHSSSQCSGKPLTSQRSDSRLESEYIWSVLVAA